VLSERIVVRRSTTVGFAGSGLVPGYAFTAFMRIVVGRGRSSTFERSGSPEIIGLKRSGEAKICTIKDVQISVSSRAKKFDALE
jgi:hypothetical protein